MFPDSPYAHPVGSFQAPVPLVTVDPDGGTLVSICLNPAWIPYVIGCLKQLLLQSTWDTSDPDDLNLVQQRATSLIGLFQEGLCDMPQTLFRLDPAGCGVQWSYDNGDTWNTGDLSTCIADIVTDGIGTAIQNGVIATPGQTSPESPPLPGECKTYHVQMGANSAWVCPAPINPGDSVTVSNAHGAWNDGSGFGAVGPWFCPNGGSFGAGICDNNGEPQEGDPLPTANHMTIVGHLVDTWFDPASSPYDVPEGVSNGQLVIQANDAVLTDNLGDVTFDVQICTIGYTHTFNFLDNDGGWIPFEDFFDGVNHVWGAWVSGQGWHCTDNDVNGVLLNSPIGAGNVTRVVEYLNEANTSANPAGFASKNGIDPDAISGSQAVYVHVVNYTLTGERVRCGHGDGNSRTGNTQYTTMVKVSGLGTDPFST